ncbi:NADAR family protein [Paraburkholderia sp. EG287A]|uniref:NADAR family protein n=1 Tax=Paraburkholderia sp. EG287A TaxID=3237012 RepID=UPI0034D291F4
MKTTDNLVLFYGQSEFYSNWNKSSFIVKGLKFANGETYMMYCKAMFFGDEETAAKILSETDPARVKALGRAVKGYVDEKWAENRLRFVRRGLLEKARQHPGIKVQLLATGNKVLAEASPSDLIWGIGLRENDPLALDPKNWRGQNLLGQAWMWVREQLRKETPLAA